MIILFSALIFLIILSILVLVHEFGHFIAAKKNGVLVEEFGLGFPPRLWGIKKGETLYSINALPLGGFVKLYGEEYHEEDKEKVNAHLKNRAFIYKKPPQKALILVAGVCMNVILGVGIFYFLLLTSHFRSDPLPVINNYHFSFGEEEGSVVVVGVIPGSAAEKAHIRAEDQVIRFGYANDTHNTEKSMTITTGNQLIDAIKAAEGKTIVIDLKNIQNGVERTVAVTPVYDPKLKRSIIGAQLADTVTLTYQKPVEKVLSGFLHAYNLSAYNLQTIGFLIQSSMTHKNIEPLSSSLSGPIGILGVVHNVVKSSGTKFFMNVLNITALFSLSLATINILPFPALDGGRLVFVVYEWITKRRINTAFERYLNLTGFAFLLLLMLAISVNDVLKLFTK